MGYIERKIGRKFPWKNLFMGIVIVVLIVVLVGVAFEGVGAWLLGIAAFVGGWLLDTAILCFTSLPFWAGFGIMGIAFFTYFYRKNYAKRKVLQQITPTLQGAPMSTQPLQPVPTVAQIIQDKDEVVST